MGFLSVCLILSTKTKAGAATQAEQPRSKISTGLNLHTCGGSGPNMSANNFEAFYFFPLKLFKIIPASDTKNSVICRFCEHKQQSQQSCLIWTFSNLPSRLRATSRGQYAWKGEFALELLLSSRHTAEPTRGGGEWQLGAPGAISRLRPMNPWLLWKTESGVGGKRCPVSQHSVWHKDSSKEFTQTRLDHSYFSRLHVLN